MRCHYLRLATSRGSQCRKLIRAAQPFGRSLGTVLLKGRLQFADQRPPHPQQDVVPMILVLRVTIPAPGETDPTGERQSTVDDANAAVRAPIRSIDAPGMCRMIIRDFAAG